MFPNISCCKVDELVALLSADCKRGRQKGAMSKNVKNRQKVSKSFSTLFDNFRAGQKTSKIVKKCQTYFRHFSTIFARHQFSGPFWGALILAFLRATSIVSMCFIFFACRLRSARPGLGGRLSSRDTRLRTTLNER